MSVMISTQVRRASNFCREQFFERRPRVWGFRTLDETRVASTKHRARPELFFSSRRGLSERGEASTADGARRARALPSRRDAVGGAGRALGGAVAARRGVPAHLGGRSPSRVPRGAPARLSAGRRRILAFVPPRATRRRRRRRPRRRRGALFLGLPRANHARGGPAAHGRGPRGLPVARGDPGRARGGGRARASAPRAVRVGAQALGARVQAVDPPRAPRRVQGPRRRELPRAPAPVRGERLHHHRARPVPRGARAGVVRPRRGRVPRGHGQGARRPRPGESRRRALGGGARDGARGRDRRRRRASGRGGPAMHRSFAPPQCVVVVVVPGRCGEKTKPFRRASRGSRCTQRSSRPRLAAAAAPRAALVRLRDGDGDWPGREALPANRRAFPRRVFTAAAPRRRRRRMRAWRGASRATCARTASRRTRS